MLLCVSTSLSKRPRPILSGIKNEFLKNFSIKIVRQRVMGYVTRLTVLHLHVTLSPRVHYSFCVQMYNIDTAPYLAIPRHAILTRWSATVVFYLLLPV